MIQKSSNVGAAKIALSLPAETLWQTFSDAGFGTPPQTGFPGEVAGRLRPAKSWRPIEQATMAYGHGISVNLVQLARAYTIFADRRRVEAGHAVQDRWPGCGPPGDRARNRARGAPHAGARDAAGRHGAQARRWPVIASPARPAPRTSSKVAGYTATSTSSSFVGFAPVSNPRLIVAVMIDEPSGGVSTTAATVAAPVFSTVTGAALRMLGVPTDAPVDNVILPPEGSEIRRRNVTTMAAGVDFDPAPLLARARRDAAPHHEPTADGVEPGDAFAAYPGAQHDGREFIGDAVSRGARRRAVGGAGLRLARANGSCRS